MHARKRLITGCRPCNVSPQFVSHSLAPSPLHQPSATSKYLRRRSNLMSPTPPEQPSAPHTCKFCVGKSFTQEGRFLSHLKKKHRLEFDNMETNLADPNNRITPGSPPVGTVPDGFRTVLALMRPLTSLETRITTTYQEENDDFDSDASAAEDDGQGSHQDQDQPRLDDHLDTPDEPFNNSPVTRREEYPGELTIVGTDMSERQITLDTLWYPFRNGYEFQLARWMMDSNLSKASIDKFFNLGLAREPPKNFDDTEGVCYTSAYTLSNILDIIDPDLSITSWKLMAVDHVGTGLIEFRYRSLETMIRHIFKQPSHADYMVYKPVKEFDSNGYRLVSEMHTGNWWWRMQVSTLKPPMLTPADGRFSRLYQKGISLFLSSSVQMKRFRQTFPETRIYGHGRYPWEISHSSFETRSPQQHGAC